MFCNFGTEIISIFGIEHYYTTNTYKMKKITLLFCGLLLSHFSFSQTYGNEWINHSQDYYKFTVGQTGVYRISQSTMNTAGIPVSSINPQNFQLFVKGKEVPVYIFGEGDGSFDPGDYIEVFLEKNDGTFDTQLYASPQQQPHSYHSIYTDSTTCFITWNSSATGKRLNYYYDNSYSGQGDSFFVHENVQTYFDQWVDGQPATALLYQSEYSAMEGWGRPIDQWRLRFAPNITLPGLVKLYSPVEVEVKFSSANNPQNFNANGNNHEVLFEFYKFTKPDKGYHEYDRMEGLGYFTHTFKNTVDPDHINMNLGRIRPSISTVGPGPTKGWEQIWYIKTTYPHGMDLQGTSDLKYIKNSSRYQEFDNYTAGKTEPRILDLDNLKRIKGDLSGQTLMFNTSTTGSQNLYIYDESDVVPIASNELKATLKEQTIDLSVPFDYLIITNKLLKTSAEEYAQYRSGISGGSHNVKLVYVDELMDEYSYGIYHPTSIRNALKRISDDGAHNDLLVLLLGKGQQYTNIRFDGERRRLLDLVPAIGASPSDYLYVSSLNFSSMTNWFPICRIPAKTDQEVRIYLNKVKEHELDPYGEWKKHKLDLAGGNDDFENQNFKASLRVYASVFAGTYVGGMTELLSKNQPLYIDPSITAAIRRIVNDGVSVVNYFGHGSPSFLEIEIGDATKLNNTGKYPLYYFNGCSVGNTFNETSLAEQYLFADSKGALIWGASSDVGNTFYLHSYAVVFSKYFYHDLYGQSISEVVKSTIDEYQDPTNGHRVKQVRQMLFYGDPAIVMYAANYPDYTAEENDILIETPDAEVDSFAVHFKAHNIAKATDDSVYVSVTQTFPDNSSKDQGTYLIGKVYSSDSIVIWLKTEDRKAGLNTFTFTLDPQNKVEELGSAGESNNVINYKAVFRDNSFTILSPRPNGVVNKGNVSLQIQQNEYFASSAPYIFELDTTPLYNSGLYQTSTVTGNFIIENTFSLPPLDSTDFFWRVKKQGDPEWKTSTFAYIYGAPEGWSEGYDKKFENTNKDLLTYQNGHWEFAKILSSNYQVWSHGGAGPLPRTMLIDGVSAWFDWSKWTGVQVLAVNPLNEKRFSYPSQYNNKAKEVWYPEYANREYYVIGTYSGMYNFNTFNKEDRDSFLKHLKMIPDGYHLFLQNGRGSGIEDWEDEIFTELEKFGIVHLKDQATTNRDPFAIIGQKGIAPGEAEEKYGDTTNPTTPVIEQEVILTASLFPPSKVGWVESPEAGPATKWGTFNITFENYDSPKDSFFVEIYANDANGTRVLLTSSDKSTIDLSTIDASVYPNLFARVWLFDSELRTPLKLKRWTFYYDGLPEGSIYPEIAYSFPKDKIQEGDTFRFNLAFKNILNQPFDSIQLNYRINNDKAGVVLDTQLLLQDLAPGQYLTYGRDLPTDNWVGKNTILISFNDNFAQPEYDLLNNVTQEEFTVVKDVRNPQLDVVFDGLHITDGEIVSPNPNIVIMGWDENPYYLLDRPEYFSVKLKKPGESDYTDIDPSDPAVVFVPASAQEPKAKLTYNPDKLPNGMYELKVIVNDRSQNASSQEGYLIRFMVINESTITRVYPYPNPMTTSTQFVFTLTGSVLPDYFKIRIMTISGRVVREITQDEIGPIRIGNNVSQYAWDGTDEFGDRLANGVYLYKVFATVNGEELELNQLDKGQVDYFKNDIGKIYIAR